MKYLKTFERLNTDLKKYILCKLSYSDRWDRNYHNEGEEPVYVIYKILPNDSGINNYEKEKLKIVYEYQNEHNFSDRRCERKNNIEYIYTEKLNDMIIYQSNNSKDIIDKLSLIIKTEKFNL